jgi:type IV pilus assembly protein PilO
MNYQMLRDIYAARPRSFAFLGFLVVLTVGLWLYLANWQRPELEKAQRDWMAKRESLAKGQTVATATRYERGMKELAQFDRRIIPKKDFPNLLGRLYDAASSNSLTLSGISFKPAPLKDDPAIVTYGIAFTVTGKYGAIKNFIGALSRFPEMVTLDSLALSSGNSPTEAVALHVQLTAYLKREGA